MNCTRQNASGRLNLDVLLPLAPNAVFSKVGGPGKEYWVFGTNYANDPDPDRVARSSIETPAWRLELSPKSASAEDRFLVVMQMSDQKAPARWPVRRVDFGERTGCLIDGPDADWMVLLNRNNGRSGNPVEFDVARPGPTHILITDLLPGRWEARRTPGSEPAPIDVPEEAGAVWLEATAGTWVLRRP